MFLSYDLDPWFFVDLGFMYLRDLFIEMLSHCKGTYGSSGLRIIKYFCKTLGSFVECLVWRLESLILSSILANLRISNIFVGCHPLREGSNLGRGTIVTELHSIPSSHHWFREYLYCVLRPSWCSLIHFSSSFHLSFCKLILIVDLFCKRRLVASISMYVCICFIFLGLNPIVNTKPSFCRSDRSGELLKTTIKAHLEIV